MNMSTHFEVAIIGAGFGGLGMAINLKKAGRDSLVLLEKAEEVGGCWRENDYPGAACDVPSYLYSYSFEPNPHWSRRFAPQAEIYDYLRHCAKKYDLYPHIRFKTEVTGARFDTASGLWHISTQAGEAAGETITARYLVTATGQLNRPQIPAIEGAESFAGAAFHSAQWRHDLDLTGKRVAVIGTGASAIQFVPAIAPQVGSMTLFQRSAPYVIPKADRAYTRLERALAARWPLWQKLTRGGIYSVYESRVLGFTALQLILKLYTRKALSFMRKHIQDPALRQKLTPDYPIGCKRVLISNDYLPALAQDNVAVVDTGISRITPAGIETRDGTRHPADVIIYGTGFQATDFLSPMAITGRDGQDLNQAWRDGAEAYLGITVHGFPNLFMLYGPNTNLGHSSIVYMLESQIHYVLAAIATTEAQQARALEVRAHVQEAFNTELQAQIRRTVWDKDCTSWYKNASGKNTNNWPGFTFRYRQMTRKVNTDDYHFITS